MLGAPLDGPAWMLGDNKSVVTNSTVPQSLLKKRHSAVSYHRVREACAAGDMWLIHTPGRTNVADVLTKYLHWCDLKDKLEAVLFRRGDTLLKSPPPKSRGVTDQNGCWRKIKKSKIYMHETRTYVLVSRCEPRLI